MNNQYSDFLDKEYWVNLKPSTFHVTMPGDRMKIVVTDDILIFFRVRPLTFSDLFNQASANW